MDAIRNVLELVARGAETYLQNANSRHDPWLTLSAPLNTDGSVNEAARDRVVMCVYNLTRETTISTQAAAQPGAGGSGSYYQAAPPLYINIHLMCMANFGGAAYTAGLGVLSQVISYFQQNPTVNHATAPDLDPSIEKVSLELASLNSSELNHVMGLFGGRYFPAVFYKLRLIRFAATAMQAIVPPARGGGIAEQGRMA
ncbi:DUF4255 domain-containing protein [Niveispirillum sp. KHB5.9]|uniref:DUF4255 domain-containing protein n=1 Tax=Niveispirillum sp. KHB5.9 TaxID=3400269 RepID=UPI003A83F897